MAGHILKSASITNLDASPVVSNTIGEGAPGPELVINDLVAPVSADDTTSTYRLCRFPTNAKVKDLKIFSAILTAGAADINVAFSDSTTDGTPPSLAGGVVQLAGPVDNKLFGAAKALFGSTIPTGPIIANAYQGTFTPAMQNIPMWQNLVTLGATQFTADPGGFFDIFLKVTTAITTGGTLSCELRYVE
jgi:hypothetical protein